MEVNEIFKADYEPDNEVVDGQQIIITKNRQEATVSITNSLIGILKGRYTIDEEKSKIMGAKYDLVN